MLNPEAVQIQNRQVKITFSDESADEVIIIYMGLLPAFRLARMIKDLGESEK